MRVTSVPSGIRRGTLLLLLSIPLAAVEVLVVSRAPWWRLPYPEMLFWSLVAASFVVPIALWLKQARPWAFSSAFALACVWTLLSGWVSIRMRRPGLAYFSIALAGYFVAVLSVFRRELSRSFLDPRIRWYQGLPRKIPGLRCHLTTEFGQVAFDVSRFDSEGAFVFRERADGPDQASRSAVAWLQGAASGSAKIPELAFVFRDREVRCKGELRRALRRGIGGGIEFKGLSPDARKELGDFVENLRGEGYAV